MLAVFKLSLVLFLLGVWIGMTANPLDAVAADSTRTSTIDGISITPDNQILVELMPEDTTPANLFDLNGRTLVFTPDGEGGYSREIQPFAWEDAIGSEVTQEWEKFRDGIEVALGDFEFDYAGQRWDSFFVSKHGLITFGGPLEYLHIEKTMFQPLSRAAMWLATSPTISALYNPAFGGLWAHDPLASQFVARWPDRVVVTWFASDVDSYPRGSLPDQPERYQAVLRADGSIQFNYGHITVRDGIVGLFSGAVVKGDVIAVVADPTDSTLPGHLDLLDVGFYTMNAAGMLVEITTRAPPAEGQFFRLALDMDRPWWTHYDRGDLDSEWGLDLQPDGERGGVWTRGNLDITLLPSDVKNRLSLLVNVTDPAARSISVIAGVGRTDGWRFSDTSHPTRIEIPAVSDVDLSLPDTRFRSLQSEVFHHQGVPNLEAIACRIIGHLGDRFDLFVFHNEFRIDSQGNGSPWRRYGNGVKGLGLGLGSNEKEVPCGEGLLLGHWERPVWMPGRSHDWRNGAFTDALNLFAHEFIHSWTAYLSYTSNGTRGRLKGDQCLCHWRAELHTPAVFPWHGEEAQSIMGGGEGRFWRDNGDGTFTAIDNSAASGPSWLDLYAMGLADASEVPDMFILRNLEPVAGNDSAGWSGQYWGTYHGDKEIVSIEQIIAAEGPREPSAAESQKVFNAGFVYLLEPGKTPTGDLLDLHAKYLTAAKEYWSHITGGRSRLTTYVDGTVDATLENPQPNSFQSGHGIIYGWACETEEIVIELAGTPVPTAYGTPRADTQARCGDTNNGFGLLVNWNNLGDGEHTVRALADGVEFANTTVRVSTFGTAFLEDVRRTVVVSDFPHPGDETTLQWEESIQNFVITDGQPSQGGGYNQVAGLDARLDSPSLGSSRSGHGIIYGWVCEAEEIVIELAGTPVRAAYGTPRADTQARCGDTNNGFGLLVNWNNLGSGEHTIRALADGVEFANTTVRVSTLGPAFLEDVRRTVVVSDFPYPGDETTLQWEESIQNFVIIP